MHSLRAQSPKSSRRPYIVAAPAVADNLEPLVNPYGSGRDETAGCRWAALLPNDDVFAAALLLAAAVPAAVPAVTAFAAVLRRAPAMGAAPALLVLAKAVRPAAAICCMVGCG